MDTFWKKTLLGVKYYRNVLTNRPISVNLEVTKRCNAACDFCDYWKTKKETVLDDYGPVVRKIDPMMVTISGGEPLLRPDLTRIITGIRTDVPVVYMALITNGSLLTLEKAQEFKDAGLNQLSVSLDFLDERHDKSRGIPGLWKRISELVPKLPALGFDRVNLNWVVMEQNFGQTMAVAEKAREWGITVSYSSYCDLKSMNDGHFLSERNREIFPSVIREIIQFKRRFKTIRSSDFFLEMMPRYYRHEKIDDCPAGLRWVQITPEGWYKPCSELPPVVFWEHYNHRTSFQKQECTQCWYGCRGEAQTRIDLKRIREFL